MSRKKAEILLILVTLGWGSSFMFMKLGLGTIEEFNLIALRFIIAFLVTVPLLIHRKNKITKQSVYYATKLGIVLFLIFTLIMYGLKTTSTANAGFLLGLTVVFVPILEKFSSKKTLDKNVINGAFLAILGIGLLTIKAGFNMNIGDLLCIIAAFLFAIHIILTSKASNDSDPVCVGIIQLGVTGVLGLIASFFLETPTLPNTPNSWVAVLSLALVCSAFGFIIQTVTQKYTTASRTGIIFSLQPIFAAMFGILLLKEPFGLKEYFGAALVILSILVSGRESSEPKLSREEH